MAWPLRATMSVWLNATTDFNAAERRCAPGSMAGSDLIGAVAALDRAAPGRVDFSSRSYRAPDSRRRPELVLASTIRCLVTGLSRSASVPAMIESLGINSISARAAACIPGIKATSSLICCGERQLQSSVEQEIRRCTRPRDCPRGSLYSQRASAVLADTETRSSEAPDSIACPALEGYPTVIPTTARRRHVFNPFTATVSDRSRR